VPSAAVVAVIMMAAIFIVIVAIVVPMLMIPVVVAVADEFLAVAFAPEMVVHPPVVSVVQVRPGFVDHYLMAMIEIEVAITRRQVVREDPAATVLINELMIGHIVVSLDVGNVIVVYVIIPGRTPGGLNADVDGNTDLCVGRVGEGDAAKDGACQ
jgi:hypothetical protein